MHGCDTPETVTKLPPHLHNASYRQLMKNTKKLSTFLMWLLLSGIAIAQAGSADLPDAPQPQDSPSAKPEIEPVGATGASDERKLIAQARRYPRGPRRPARPPHGGIYASGFSSPPGLSLIGALIGFGAGAVIGASNPADGTVRAHVTLGLIGGTVGAFIGGVIGGAFPHFRRGYPPYGPDDDDDSDLRSDARRIHAKRPIPTKPAAPSQPTGVEATAQASPEEPAVP